MRALLAVLLVLAAPAAAVVRTRALRQRSSYPTSAVHDIALDSRGRLLAAGSLHDTDLFIREDYGQPHLAVWRVRTR